MDIYLLDRARAQLLVQLRRESSLDYRGDLAAGMQRVHVARFA